jgi:hypothetical protein
MQVDGASDIEVATIGDDGNPAIRGTGQKRDKRYILYLPTNS